MTEGPPPEGYAALRRRRGNSTIARIARSKATQPVVATIILGLATLYFDYRIRSVKSTARDAEVQAVEAGAKANKTEVKTELGYETLAPLVRDLQEQVKVLSAQVELLREVALTGYRPKSSGSSMLVPSSIPKAPIQKLKAIEPEAASVSAAAEAPPLSLPK